jgi:predicted ferric reductase
MTIWEAITWDVARAGGLTAYLLLGLAVVVGLALSLHWQSPRWPRIINSELHNFLTLLATIFVGVHLLAVALDPFTHFGLNELLLPLASHYRPLWTAFGIVGLYLGIAIGISTWLRPRLGYALWRKLHYLTLILFVAVTVHGIATGSDTSTWWAMAIYVISTLSVGTLLILRLRAALRASHGSGSHLPVAGEPDRARKITGPVQIAGHPRGLA